MADWRMTGTYFKSCNCDPGCPCDFMSPPTYHKCEGVLGMQVEEENFGDVSLHGMKWAKAHSRWACVKGLLGLLLGADASFICHAVMNLIWIAVIAECASGACA